ncbi:MAG: phytoene desaturase [Flavobacteriales bacterium]|nr:phytoene desaturase [Flavobacteriales bacterium]
MSAKKKKIQIIGGGFSGLSAACALASSGCEVTLLEKNSTIGGRARAFHKNGFMFDMGPSWYWMPDVIENFFSTFGHSTRDYFDLKRLDPSYRIFYDDGPLDVPASMDELRSMFESLEPGSAARLDAFLTEARVKYDTGMGRFVWKPSLTMWEYMHPSLLGKALKLDLFSSVSKHVRKYFRHPKLVDLLEFPVLFLGAQPDRTPALYTLMNYADLSLGTWYPMGGMVKLPEAIRAMAESLGVTIKTNAPVISIVTGGGRVTGTETANGFQPADAVLAACDYHHVEQKLLKGSERTYNDDYWHSRTMSPSSMLFYVGINRKIPGLRHHNLFFDEPFGPHAESIYERKDWPERPRFYACCPSVTDPDVAPEGCENLFLLIPAATNLSSDPAQREVYFKQLIARMEKQTGVNIMEHVMFYDSYAHEEFIRDYNAFGGNAYGLANTLRQTAWMKPTMKSRKLKNLYFSGQLTVPGPGVPPALISGQLAAQLIRRDCGIPHQPTSPQLV